MSELSLEEKCKTAAKLIEQAPPGEVNDVINDIRAIINDDQALMPHVLPSLRAYNLANLLVVEHPAAEGVPAHTSVLSEAGIVPGEEKERFIDAVGKRSFVFDHISLVVSDYQPYELPKEEESFRAELATSLAAYAKNHFLDGFSTVSCSQFPLLPTAFPAPEAAAAAYVSKRTGAESSEVPESPEPSSMEEATSGPVTDVVAEQVGAGENEPLPTPLAEDVDPKKEEVDEPGGIEKLDEAVEEVKHEEEDEEAREGKGEVEPKVEDETTASPQTGSEEGEEEKKLETVTEPETASKPRRQERVENPVYTVEIVGNRYNPSNFWTGRWRTRWVVDKANGQVEGTISVDVHYYEQGNVQLTTSHSASFPCPVEANGSQSVASQIVTTISKIETAYHLELNDVYGELGDKAFRALRRALPVTRQKMDWEKVSGYSLGADLTKARS